MKKCTVQCPAKINLTLEIVNRRDDGFHNIKSIMQMVSLYDYLDIELEEAEKTEILLDGKSDEVPYDNKNLVYKAAQLFLEKTGKKAKINIYINKNIPVSAGLAGGSTDAAGTIAGLNRLLGTPLNKEDMHPQALYHGVIVVGNTKDEVGKDGDPTGRMVLTGIIPQYGNRVDVVKFIVENEKAKNHIETYYSKGDTVEVQAKLNFSTKTTYEEVEMGFGDPIVKPRTESVREIIIVSGSEGGLEGELAYEKEAIDAALQRRKEYLASQKEVSEKTEKKKNTPSFSVDDF